MKLDAMKHQGQRTDLTSSPLDKKLKGVTVAQQISKDSGDSQPQIYRYIRLTNLLPELLDMVDNSVLKEKDKLLSAPVIKCKKTPRKRCSFVAERRKKR